MWNIHQPKGIYLRNYPFIFFSTQNFYIKIGMIYRVIDSVEFIDEHL